MPPSLFSLFPYVEPVPEKFPGDFPNQHSISQLLELIGIHAVWPKISNSLDFLSSVMQKCNPLLM
jgi:hypothetical protein